VSREDDYVEVYQRADGLFDWRRVAENSQVVSTSGGQGYVDASACEAMAQDLNFGIEVRRV
jgi:uncharacterized protein YegP (UPF0339 family)